MRESRRGVVVALAASLLAAGGCTEIENALARVSFLNFMHESPAFDPYEAPRNAPPNSVPVESPGEKWEPPVERTEVGLRAFGDTMTNPLPRTEPVLTRGAEVFATYCSVCHGAGAQGDGPIVAPGKFPLATNLTLPTTVGRSDGYIYAIVRVGRGLMPSYQRIPPRDRWAVVHYIRYLQQGNAPMQVSIPGGVIPAGAAPAAAGAGPAPDDTAGRDTAPGQGSTAGRGTPPAPDAVPDTGQEQD